MAKKLSALQKAFIEEFLKDLNAYQAALRAGYAETTAKKQSYQWVGKYRSDCPEKMWHVWDAIESAKMERCDRLKVDSDYVLRRLTEIDKLDVMDIMDDCGHLKKLSEWPKAWRISVSGIEITELIDGRLSLGQIKKIKWPDKMKNLELIGRHVAVKAFDDKGEGGGSDLIAEALAKLASRLPD